MNQPNYLNAAYTGIVAFLGAIVTVMTGGVTFADVEQGQWLVAILAGLTAAGGALGITRGSVQGSHVAVLMDGNTPLAGPAARQDTGSTLNRTDTIGAVAPATTTGGTTGE